MEYNVSLDIRIFCEYKKMSLDNFAKATGLSLSLLSKIVNKKIEPKKELIERIYSFFYIEGFDINKYKVEYLSKDHNVVLFHGAKNIIEGDISLDHSRKMVDFGPGFYTGELYEQSLDFICDKDKGSIYVLDADYSNLKIKTLTVSLEWILWIAVNRGKLDEYKNTKLYQNIVKEMNEYDLIIAPIADNRMFTSINDFVNGGISSEAAIHSMLALDLGNQIVFKTCRSLTQLKILDHLYVSKEEKRAARDLKLEKILNSGTFVKTNYLKHAREGLYINEVFERERI